MAFLSKQQLIDLGFKYIGHNVLISDKASIHGTANIAVGDFTRIDDFCILSAGKGGITIGRNVHLSCYVSLIGHANITIGDFVALSGKVSVYSSSDNFQGDFMTNPTVNANYTDVTHKDVLVEKHVIVGSGSIVLPGVNLGEGVSVGALSLVNRDCAPYGIYAGTPARFLKERSRGLLALERKYLENEGVIDTNI